MGMIPIFIPIFSMMLNANIAKIPAATHFPKVSRARDEMWIILASKMVISRMTNTQPIKPVSSPITAKMESDILTGIIFPLFIVPFPSPSPVSCPEPIAVTVRLS